MYCKGKGRAYRAVWDCSLCCASPGKGKRESNPATWFVHFVVALLHITASRSPALWKKAWVQGFFFFPAFFCSPSWQVAANQALKRSLGGMSAGSSPSLGPLAASVSRAPSSSSVLDLWSNRCCVAGVLLRWLCWALFCLGTSGYWSGQTITSARCFREEQLPFSPKALAVAGEDRL